MAGRMSIRRYLKPIDGLPDPNGSLSTTIPSVAIYSICMLIGRIDISLNLVAILPVTVQRIYRRGNLSHKQAIALSSTLTARLLNVRTIFGVCIIIESVDSINRDERGFLLTQYITNWGISRARNPITHFKHHHRVLRLISNRMSV